MYIEGDVPSVVTTSGGSNGGGNGSWANSDAWVLIILFALIFGNGFGGNGGFGGSNGIAENYVLATDFASIERKIDGVNNGLCDGFYNTLENFNTTNMNISGGFARLDTNLCQLGNNITQSINGVSRQLADCCCGIDKSLLENRYLDAQNTCAITNAIAMNTRDVIENANKNYRAIHEELINNKIEMKNERIAELTMKLNKADLRASQEAQNNYLIAALGPKCPQPAYVVQPPQQVTFPTDCCGTVNYANYNNGCGCC